MTFSHYAKVKNVLTVDTKWGKRRVCNVTTDRGEEAIWATDLNAFSNIKAGMTINVIRGAKGGLTILEKSPSMSEVSNGNGNIQMNRPSSQQEGSYYTYSSNEDGPLNNVVNDILDLPVFSQRDRQAMAEYIKSQAKLLRYCYKVCAEQFPEMVGKDERGLRSLAISLLISSNTARDKYKL